MDFFPSLKGKVSNKEWQIRCDLAALYRLSALEGWTDLIFTHISYRLPDEDGQARFLINPFGLLFDEIAASRLIKVDMNGRIINEFGIEFPFDVNPAGFNIHGAVHAARPDAHVVMHLHTKNGVAVSAQKDGLLPLSQNAMIIGHDLAYHDYEGIALNPDERERLITNLGQKNNMILRNHGLLTVGDHPGICFYRMFFLEQACDMQIKALSAGRDNVILADSTVQSIVASQAKPIDEAIKANGLAWPALLRKLKRLEIEYDV